MSEYNEVARWIDLLAPNNKPRPARMEVGRDVVEILKQQFSPMLEPDSNTAWSNVDMLYGVPIYPRGDLPNRFWRIIDECDMVVIEGEM